MASDVIYFEYKPLKAGIKKIYVWDLDKTYLDTHFEGLRGLLKTAFEKAFQKRNVPGSATLVRALQKEDVAIFFISASPPQMEKKIREKFKIDGIEPHGIFLKDNLKNLRFKKFHRLKQQVGYKVEALMQLRAKLDDEAKQILFGDDSESDAVVYSLYSDICARRLPTPELISVLKALHVLPEQLTHILKMQNKIKISDPVDQIYINLAADTDPDYYAKFGRRTLATFNSFQAALCLFDRKSITLEQLISVAQDMIKNFEFTPDELARSLNDLTSRRFFSKESAAVALDPLQGSGFLPSGLGRSFNPVKTILNLKDQVESLGEKILGIHTERPWVPESIDYLRDFR